MLSFFLSLVIFMISRRQIISGSAGQIFTNFSPNESVLGADDRSGPLFLISQGMLPWQLIWRKKWQIPLIHHSGILKRNGISLPECAH